MIVSCEKCRTQFRLDDSKVPESGARVRCSKCDHAFCIAPPGQADDLQADRLAHEAVQSARTASGEEVESDWEFNHDAEPSSEAAAGLDAAREAVDDLLGALAGSAPEAAAEVPSAVIGEMEAAPELGVEPATEEAEANEAAESNPEDGLGSPEGWNFFEDAEDSDDAEGTEIGHVSLMPRWKLLEQEREEAESAMEARVAAAERDAAQSSVRRRRLGRVGTGLGWVATLWLLAAGAWGTVARAPAPAAAAAELEIPGFRAVQVEARWLDNAVSGPLYVVSGRLQRADGAQRGAAGGLVVRLLDAEGAAIAAEPTPVGPAFPERALRERDPAGLRAAQARASAAFAQLHRGETVVFQAIFADVPAEAARLALETAR